MSFPKKIISGGQAGVDRAALDAAIALNMPHGGWCPRGRLAEDGRISDRYRLRETDSSDYAVRTERNVLDSDATLVLCRGEPRGGTLLTIRLAQRHGRPHLAVDLDQPPNLRSVLTGCKHTRLQRSTSPGRGRVKVQALGHRQRNSCGGCFQAMRLTTTNPPITAGHHPHL